MKRIVRLSLGLLVSTFAFAAVPVHAEDWPTKPIKVVIPFGPGGTADILARAIQKEVAEKSLLSQPIVISNVTGHFSVGARQVLDANPDDHTFLLVHLALMSGKASGAIDFSYGDFAPVAATGEVCELVAVKEGSPYTSLGDLLTAATQRPDSVVFGVNIGALNHMAGITLENTTPGAKFRYAQIGGGPANFAALIGGQIDATVFSGAEYLSYKASGVKGLALMSAERDTFVPDLATTHEVGNPAEFCFQFFWLAPKGTSQASIDRFAGTLKDALATEGLTKFLQEQAMGARFVSGDDYVELLKTVDAQITPLAKQAAR